MTEWNDASRTVVAFDPRNETPALDRVVWFVEKEISRRIELLIANQDGDERNRGAIEALRWVLETPEREFSAAAEIMNRGE